MSFRLGDDEYYADRPVPHSAQGDLHSDVPLPIALAGVTSKARGARKRPLDKLFPQPSSGGMYLGRAPLAVICNYTCGFVAQPPGTDGYSHPLRQVAPVRPLAELVNGKGMQRTEARRLKDVGMLSGLMFLPAPEAFVYPDLPGDDEFGPEDFAICLYQMATVTQEALDESARVARLSLQAQKILTSGLISLVGPDLYLPSGLTDPDMGSSW